MRWKTSEREGDGRERESSKSFHSVLKNSKLIAKVAKALYYTPRPASRPPTPRATLGESKSSGRGNYERRRKGIGRRGQMRRGVCAGSKALKDISKAKGHRARTGKRCE